jgi:parallel beta-helix repeat protein
MDMGTKNYIINNTIYDHGLGTNSNRRSGIKIISSSNNVIKGNILYNNSNGIYLNNSWTDYCPVNTTITGNSIYTNDIGLRIGNISDNTISDNLIFDNSLNVKLHNESKGNDFINNSLWNAEFYDFDLHEDSHAILLNTTFNKTRVNYGDTKSTLIVKWYMHVNVIYANASPVSFANIWVEDKYGVNILDGQVDFWGWTRWLVVTEYKEQDLNGDHIGEKIFYSTPHHIAVTDGNLWGYAHPIMNISKVVLIICNELPALLPPANLTTKAVSSGNYIELEWDPPSSSALDHYLIYRSDSATDFDFSTPYRTMMNPISVPQATQPVFGQ